MFFRKRMMLLIVFLLFSFQTILATVSENAGKLLITEVAIKETNDWIELYVVDGSVDWSNYRVWRNASKYFTLPSNTYATGQYIVLHQETGSDGLVGNCWHFYDAFDGSTLTGTDQNIFITDIGKQSTYVDALIYSNSSGSYGASKDKANDIVDDGLWDDYDFTNGDAGAWTDTYDVHAGETIARYMNGSHTGYIDNNLKTDWYHSTAPSKGGANDSSLPVFLTSFSASIAQNGILLRWSTAGEVSNAGFYVCRSENNSSDFTRITNLIPGAGNSDEAKTYQFVDQDVTVDETYYYRIEDVDINGITAKHQPISITYRTVAQKENSPQVFTISSGYPSPFGAGLGKTATSIQLNIPKETAKNPFTIGIFNLLGQKVYQFPAANYRSGTHILHWHGMDDYGARLSAGPYFWVVQSKGIHEVRRVMLLK